MHSQWQWSAESLQKNDWSRVTNESNVERIKGMVVMEADTYCGVVVCNSAVHYIVKLNVLVVTE